MNTTELLTKVTDLMKRYVTHFPTEASRDAVEAELKRYGVTSDAAVSGGFIVGAMWDRECAIAYLEGGGTVSGLKEGKHLHKEAE